MSGGVDSSVSAALLKKAGYDVTGVFIKVWTPDWFECTWKEDRIDAMRAAATIGIPFVTLDLEKEYKKDVVDYMIDEYKIGRTPNPDVMCNRSVKFGAFWKWAKEQGADYIATGHYAQAEYGVRSQEGTQQYRLLKGNDENKDQSYFLWTLEQADLEHVMFPVGNIEKPEVRKLARKFKLPNAEKKDSQGLCFLGKIDIKEFLPHYINIRRGAVMNDKGVIIGHHPGALLFTIGERHGFTITEKSPNDEPYYIIAKDVVDNTITVSPRKPDESLPHARREVVLSKVNWISGIPSSKLKLKARSRYRQQLNDVKLISTDKDTAKIEFSLPQDTLAPGQSLVIYHKDECLGGGIIE